uniref:Uncharacterized protein n=1 Tax=Arundo donax TaxID=35708 RepID=A0A0A8Z4H7_ARUDO
MMIGNCYLQFARHKIINVIMTRLHYISYVALLAHPPGASYIPPLNQENLSYQMQRNHPIPGA